MDKAYLAHWWKDYDKPYEQGLILKAKSLIGNEIEIINPKDIKVLDSALGKLRAEWKGYKKDIPLEKMDYI